MARTGVPYLSLKRRETGIPFECVVSTRDRTPTCASPAHILCAWISAPPTAGGYSRLTASMPGSGICRRRDAGRRVTSQGLVEARHGLSCGHSYEQVFVLR